MTLTLVIGHWFHSSRHSSRLEAVVKKPADMKPEKRSSLECSVVATSTRVSPTEQSNGRSCSLSTMSLADSIRLMVEEEARAVHLIQSQADKLEQVVQAAVHSIASGGRLVYIGAGTSARLSVLSLLFLVIPFNSLNYTERK